MQQVNTEIMSSLFFKPQTFIHQGKPNIAKQRRQGHSCEGNVLITGTQFIPRFWVLLSVSIEVWIEQCQAQDTQRDSIQYFWLK